MPDRWRTGSRNPFTVYRVADGAYDVDHAREHFVTSFRREEDARLAVEAVNAQADRVDLDYPAGRWRDVYVRVHGDKEVATTEQVTDTIRVDWSAPNAGGEVDIVGVEVVAATGVEVDGEPTTPPSCDCPTTDGAVHLTLVSNPHRVGGDVTIGHSRLTAATIAALVRRGLDAEQIAGHYPQVTPEEAGLLERFVAVLDGDDEDGDGGLVHDGDTCQSADSDLESAQGELNEARLWLARRGVDVKAHRSLTWALNEAERAGVVGRPATDPAGSAVGQRGDPIPAARAEAWLRSDGVIVARANDGWESVEVVHERDPDPTDAIRLVPVAALRDGGEDTGGEDEGPFRVVGEGGDEYPGPKAPRDVDLDACPIYPCCDPKTVEVWKASGTWKPCAHDRRTLVGEIARLRAVVGWVKANDHVHTWQVAKRLGKDYGRASAEIARLRGELARMRSEEREDVTKLRGKVDVYRQLAASRADSGVLARLSTALDVSLDPDDPDPVGRLVEAAGKAVEVEVVSGAEAAELPVGSLIRSEECPHWPERDRLRWRTDESEWHTLAGIPAELHGPGKYSVVYRAPAPAPAALAVGDELAGPADATARAKAGTLVQSPHRGQRGVLTGDFSDGPVRAVAWETGEHLDLDNLIAGCWPMRVLDVPEPSVRVGTGGGES